MNSKICLMIISLIACNAQASESPFKSSAGKLQSTKLEQQDRTLECTFVPDGIIGANFDGHGGKGPAKHLKKRLIAEYLQCSQQKKSVEETWQNVMTNMDREVLESDMWDNAGTTAVVFHIDLATQKIHLIAVGDSRGYCFSSTGELYKNSDGEDMIVGPGSAVHGGINEKKLAKIGEELPKELNFWRDDAASDPRARPLIHVDGKYIEISTAIGNKHLQVPGRSRFDQPVVPLVEIKSMDLPNELFYLLLCSDGISDLINPIEHLRTSYFLSHYIEPQRMVCKLLTHCEDADDSKDIKHDNKSVVAAAVTVPAKLQKFVARKLIAQDNKKNIDSNQEMSWLWLPMAAGSIVIIGSFGYILYFLSSLAHCR